MDSKSFEGIVQTSRKLYTIRNVRGRALRKTVMEANPLGIEFYSPTIEEVAKRFQVDDVNTPSYIRGEIGVEVSKELPTILSGNNLRWKLWEAEVYTDRLTLHYLDMYNQTKGRAKTTDLSCFAFWTVGMELLLSTPPEQKITPEYYHLCFTAAQKDEGYLSVIYPSEKDGPDGIPMVCDETYGFHPKR